MLLVDFKMNDGTIIKGARICKPYSFIPIKNKQEIDEILIILNVLTGYGNNVQFASEVCSGFIDRTKIESYIIKEVEE